MSQPNETPELLPRAEVINAVERNYPSRIPLVRAKWWGEGLGEQYGDRLQHFDRYPEDVDWVFVGNPIDPNRMNLSWDWNRAGAHDSRSVIDDWAQLDEFIDKLPSPDADPQFEQLLESAEKSRANDRYLIYGWWGFFFERPWGLRGMENLLCDYHISPEQIHRLHDAMCDVYCAYIRRAGEVFHPDGFWTSDDLGHQTGPMMGPAIFHDLIFPYYKRVGDAAEESGMHFWLHSCGDNAPLLPDLIEAGVTVFHPVQKHTMDEKAVAAEFGDRLTFLSGFDVQHVLQEASPDEVRAEMRFMIETFDRPEGGMCIAAGNGIVSGTPFENIDAFLDEAVQYGRQHRAQFSVS
jgi:uroporphyrinogen decarboxylase